MKCISNAIVRETLLFRLLSTVLTVELSEGVNEKRSMELLFVCYPLSMCCDAPMPDNIRSIVCFLNV